MLRISGLRLRSITKEHVYGADVFFGEGLNIVQAGNTSGKSTCLQAIIYALGLERSLGPQLEVPLPYAMREKIHAHKDDPYEKVIQSYVELELLNKRDQYLSIRRDIEGGTEKKLIQTWSGPKLSNPNTDAPQRDYFVHDPGAAVREDGFHSFLTKFIGWELPEVPRYDGTECPLYLETIFPMLFVEQKRGWSAIQGPFPTYLRIQDLPRRVLEFLLDLDAGKIRRERAELNRQISLVNQKWSLARQELDESSGRLSRFKGIPTSPTAEFSHAPKSSFEIYHDDDWVAADEVLSLFNKKIQELEEVELPKTESISKEQEDRLEAVKGRYEELQALIETLRQDYSLQRQERDSVRLRLSALEVDLRRNQDAMKLQELGSILGIAAGTQACPTCHQDVARELLPEISTAGMAIDENIAFVKSQISLYRSTLASAENRLAELQTRYSGFEEELRERRKEIRSLRQSLISPSQSSSRAVVEEIVRTQARVERWLSIREKADAVLDSLQTTAKEWTGYQDRLKNLEGKDLTEADNAKLKFLGKEIREHLARYGFKSFQPKEIKLSSDNFRPLVYATDPKEPDRFVEKEIGYEVSASDAIRLKWAYYMALMSISNGHYTNHPALAIFDEPGQQEVEEANLFGFLKWLSQNLSSLQQVIIATSAPINKISENLANEEYKITTFEGFILQPL